MKAIYIADDGTKFDDEWDCEDYEWRQKHQSIEDVKIYDMFGNELPDILSEQTYNDAARIVVKTEEAVKVLHEVSDYMGFCLYDDITSPGVWVFIGKGLNAAFVAEMESQPKLEKVVKDCRNCKYGKYNDHYETWFCYIPDDCIDWNQWSMERRE